MIVGKGLIASIFSSLDSDELLIFASGVSNSTCVIKSEYEREKKLLIESILKNKDSKLIYFSTCDVYDNLKNTMYVKHKLEIEEIIKKECNKWLIYRLPQVIGIGNRNNLLYFLVNNIIKGIPFDCSLFLERNLIKKEELLYLGNIYSNINNEIINLANPININVGNIVNIVEEITNKKSIINISEEKNKFEISLREDFPSDIFSETYYRDSIRDFIESFIIKNI